MPPSVTGFSRKSFQLLTGEVCQVTQVLTESVIAPSQVNFALSYFWVGSNSGAMPAMRVNVPKVSPSLGAAWEKYCATRKPPAPGMFCGTITGLPAMCLPMWRASVRAYRS